MLPQYNNKHNKVCCVWQTHHCVFITTLDILEGPEDDSIRIETCCYNTIINIIKFCCVWLTHHCVFMHYLAYAQQNRLTTHLSERIPVVNRRVTAVNSPVLCVRRNGVTARVFWRSELMKTLSLSIGITTNGSAPERERERERETNNRATGAADDECQHHTVRMNKLLLSWETGLYNKLRKAMFLTNVETFAPITQAVTYLSHATNILQLKIHWASVQLCLVCAS